MLAIFGDERLDPRLPVCYTYIFVEKERPEKTLVYFEKVYLEEEVNKALEGLPKSKGDRDSEEWNRLRRILELRFALLGGESLTLEEVGKRPEFGVTRERIHDMEAKALRILRHPSRSGKLKQFFVPTPEQLLKVKERR